MPLRSESTRPNSIGSARADGSDAMCVDPAGACLDGAIKSWPGTTTIADKLAAAGLQMTGYIDGYDAAVAATAPLLSGGTVTGCAHASPECPNTVTGLYDCVYEPADVPYAYFDSLRDDPTTSPGTPNEFVKDYEALAQAVDQGTLPEVVYVHGYTFRNEHPRSSTITDGIAFVQQTIDRVLSSPPYKDDTLVLLRA